MPYVTKADYPTFVRGKSYSWMRNPLQKLRGTKFEVTDVITTRYYGVKEKNIKYLDIVPGAGPAVSHGQQVSFLYEVFEDGNFENLVKRKQHSKVRLGTRKVCEGLEIGIEGMKVDGVRRIIVPPDLGSGHKHWCFGCKRYRVFDLKLLSIDN